MSATARPMAERFMKALQAFEADGRPEPLVELFADDAELSNMTHSERGRDGARRFWEEYREAFAAISSGFTAVTVAPRQTQHLEAVAQRGQRIAQLVG